MALQIPGTTSIGTGVRLDLTTVDSAFITRGITIASTSSTAIYGSGSSHSVQVAGTVFGLFEGIELGGSITEDTSQAVVVADGAFVGSDLDGAIEIRGGSSSVINEGTISGRYGILIGGAGSSQSTITNSGTITGALDAILRVFGSTETLLVTNHGQIAVGGYGADRYAFDNNNTDAVEIIRNRGSITGDIDFGLGDDIYDGRRGTIEGTVLGGDGNDTFFAGEADEVF